MKGWRNEYRFLRWLGLVLRGMRLESSKFWMNLASSLLALKDEVPSSTSGIRAHSSSVCGMTIAWATFESNWVAIFSVGWIVRRNRDETSRVESNEMEPNEMEPNETTIEMKSSTFLTQIYTKQQQWEAYKRQKEKQNPTTWDFMV